MDQVIASGFLEAVNEKTDAARLLQKIGYATDKMQVVGDSIKAFCPIHRDTRFRALLVDGKKHTFKCTSKTCQGYSGGSLVDLYAAARQVDPIIAAAEIVGALDIDMDPEWSLRLADSYMDEAEQACAAAEFESAEHSAQLALRFNPTLQRSHLLLADVYVQQDKATEACQEFAIVAEAHLAASDFEQADALLERAADIFPESEDIAFLRIRSAELQGKPELAQDLMRDLAQAREKAGRGSDNLGIYKQLIDADPQNVELRLKLAEQLEKRRDFKTATREIEKAGMMLLEQGNIGEAIPLLEKVLQREPQLNKLRMVLVDKLCEEGDFLKAKDHIFLVANAQIEASDFNGAIKTAQKWLEVEPESVEAHDTIGRGYSEQGLLDEAASEMLIAAELAEKAGDTVQALEFLFRVKFARPDDIDLRRRLIETLTTSEQFPRAAFEYLDLAEFFFSQEKDEEAEEALRSAAECNPNPDFQLQVAASLASHGREDAAHDIQRSAAEAAEREGQLEVAIEAYRQILEWAPEDLELAAHYVRLMFQAGMPLDAVDYLKVLAPQLMSAGLTPLIDEIITISADYPPGELEPVQFLFDIAAERQLIIPARIFYEMLDPVLREEAPDAALDCAKRLLEMAPEDALASLAIAEVSAELGLASESGEAYLNLFKVYHDQEELSAAMQYLELAARQLPGRPELIKYRAELLAELGDIEGAKRAQLQYLDHLKGRVDTRALVTEYENYLRLEPNDASARHQFAALLAETGQKGDALAQYGILLGNLDKQTPNSEVIALREKMLALDPDNPRIQSGLARSYFREGMGDLAIPLLLRSTSGFVEQKDMVEAASVAHDAHLFFPTNIDVLENLSFVERQRENEAGYEECLLKLLTLYRTQNRTGEAAQKAELLVMLQPGNLSYRRQLAEVREEAGAIEGAVAAWKEVAGLLSAKDGQAERLDVYNHLVELSPSDLETLKARALLAHEIASVPEAETSYLQYMQAALDASDWNSAEEAVVALRRINDKSAAVPKALAKLAHAHGQTPEAVRLFLEAAAGFELVGETVEMAAAYRGALAIEPDNEILHEQLASKLEALGQAQDAFQHRIALLRIALKDRPEKVKKARLKDAKKFANTSSDHRFLAQLLVDNELFEEATPEIEKAVEAGLSANDFHAVLEACDIHPHGLQQSLVLRRAKAQALRELGPVPAYTAWLREAVDLAMQSNELVQAEEFAILWNEITPSDPDAQLAMARIYRSQQRSQRAAEMFLSAGNALRSMGSFDSAAEAIKEGLAIDMENTALRQILWQVLLDASREEEALQEMQQLADLFIERRAYKEGATLLSRILDYRTNSPDTLERLAALVYEHEGFDKALPYFRKLLSLKRNTADTAEVGQEYERLLQLEGAGPDIRIEYAEFLDEKANDKPGAREQFLAVAQTYRDELNDPANAIQYFTQAVEILETSENARVYEEISSLHLALKDVAQSAEALRRAARLYDEAENYARAVACIERVGTLNLTDSRAPDFEYLGQIHLKQNDKTKAAEAFGQALLYSSASETFNSARKRALCEKLLEIDPLSFAAAEALIESLPEKEIPGRVLDYAHRFEAAGRQEEQVRVLKQGKALAPKNLEIRQELVAAMRARGMQPKFRVELIELCKLAAGSKKMDIARSALNDLAAMESGPSGAVEMAPLYALCGDTDAAMASYCSAAETLAEQGRYDDAASYLSSAFEIDRANVPAALVASLVRRSNGQKDISKMASDVLEGALLARSRTRALVIGTALLEVAQEFSESKALLLRIFQRSGAAFLVAIAGAHCDWLLERERNDHAARIIDFVTITAPNSPDAWWLAAQLWRKLGDKEQAAQASVKAAKLYSEAGAVTEEETCYREALEEFPDDAGVLETLSFFYEREKRMNEASEMFRRLADLAAKSKNQSGAISWLKRSIAVTSGDIEAREKLAELLLQSNRADEAVEQMLEIASAYSRKEQGSHAVGVYERILTIEPGNDRALTHLLDVASKAGDLQRETKYSLQLAEAKAESGAFAQACQILKSLVKRDPDNDVALEKLALYADRAQDKDSARIALTALAQRLASQGNYMDAIAKLEPLLGQKHRDAETLQLLIEYSKAEGMRERGADFASQLLELCKEAADYPRMKKAAETVLEYDPDRADAHSNLAESLFCLNQVSEAADEWARAAELFQAKKESSAAIGALQRLTEATPANQPPWKKLAELLLAAGRADEARSAYTRLCDLYLESGEDQNAEAVIMRLQQIDPDDVALHEKSLTLFRKTGRKEQVASEIKWLADHYSRTGDLSGAERLAREAAEADPDNLELQERRLELLLKLGRKEEAHFLQAELADRLMSAGDLARAVKILEQLREDEPDRLDILRQLAEVKIQLKDTAGAFDEYARVIACLLRHSEAEEARETAEDILEDYPEDLELRMKLAEVFVRNGSPEVGARYYASCAALAAATDNVDDQIRFLRKATDARPRWSEGLRQLAEACITAGRKEEAAELLEKVEVLLLETKQLPEAVTVVRKHVSLTPREAAPRRLLVELLGRLGERDDRAEALEELASLYVSRGETDLAIEAYRELVALRPEDPAVLQKFVELFAQVGNELEIVDEYLRLAEALAKRGDIIQATQTYEQILAIDRKNIQVRERFVAFLQSHGQKGRAVAEMRKLGDLYISKKDYQNAIVSLTNAMTLSPKEAEICLTLASAYQAAGNRDAALSTYARAATILSSTSVSKGIELYRRMLASDPDNTQILRRLGEQLFKKGDKAEAAINARRLAEIHSSRGEIDLAEAAYRMASEYQPETVETLREAIQNHSYDPGLLYLDYIRYGDRLIETGRIDDALNAYREARSLNDERPQLIQKFIEALVQVAPEEEAIPDYLALAERLLIHKEYTKARETYEHVLQLDPKNEDARSGQSAAFKNELMESAGEEKKRSAEDSERLKSASRKREKRVDIDELMNACDDSDKNVGGGGD